VNSDFNEFLSILPNLRKLIKLTAVDPHAPKKVQDLVAWYSESGVMWHKDGPPGVGFVFPTAVRFLFEFERLDKKVILIRSPKTGSATLNSLFGTRFPHLAPAIIRRLITEEEWHQATKICFVRNTFDRLVSWFLCTSRSWSDYGEKAQQFYENYGVRYSASQSPTMERSFLKEGFREWIKDGAPALPHYSSHPGADIADSPNVHTLKEINNLPHNIFDQLAWAHDTVGNAKPDFVGRFENFAEDARRSSTLIGTTPTEKLPHKNKTIDRLSYQEYYDNESVDKVTEMFQKEIEFFGYKF